MSFKIILDTNFLFIPFKFNVDIIREFERLFSKNYKLFIFSSTIKELDNLKSKKSKDRKLIPLIEKFLINYNVSIIEVNENYTDGVILKNLDKNYIVATNDIELRKKILQKNSSIKILILRQKKYLSFL